MIHGLDETSAKQKWKVQCNRNLGCPIQKCNDSGDHYSWEGGLESIQCKLKVTVPFQNKRFPKKSHALYNLAKKTWHFGRHVFFSKKPPSYTSKTTSRPWVTHAVHGDLFNPKDNMDLMGIVSRKTYPNRRLIIYVSCITKNWMGL